MSIFKSNRLARLVLILPLLLSAGLASAEDDELTNYKSGIDVKFSGTKGVAYMEEYFYHDKLVTDRKVVFIRSDTEISMSHNDRNSGQLQGKHFPIIGANGADGVANSGDEGVIRFKIDRDLSPNYNWSSRSDGGVLSKINPAYEGPFTFDSLRFDLLTPVVGAVGPRPLALIVDKENFYWRGVADSYGDEWHTITVADDDDAFVSDPEGKSSDGKVLLFVVNPKTPCLTIRASGNAQFYTTPPKAYYVPRIAPQTTYLLPRQGDLSIEIKDIMGGDVFYKINQGPWESSANPTLQSTSFVDGQNTLSYYSSLHPDIVKERKIIKNPGFPSSGEAHGNLLWGDNAAFEAVTERLKRAPYKKPYELIRNNDFWNGHTSWDRHVHLGQRYPYETHPASPFLALNNAFVALVEGTNFKASKQSKSFANYAKEMLVEHIRTVDPVGFEIRHDGFPIPSRELMSRGYYDANSIFDGVAAYDILIANYRSDQHPEGITPIEDFLIRDYFAGFVLECAQWLGGWTSLPPGMWGTARSSAGLMAAIAMPSYSSPCYGTSGFDGNTTIYPWTPYPNVNSTWKKLLWDDNNIPIGYPNQTYLFNPDALYTLAGQWGNKVAYATYPLMGHCLYNLANIARLRDPSKTYPLLMKGFANAIEGKLIGTFPATGLPDGTGPIRYNAATVLNKRFPDLADIGIPALKAEDQEAAIREAGVFGLVWYDDTSMPVKPLSLNSLTDHLVVKKGNAVILGSSTGATKITVSVNSKKPKKINARTPLSNWYIKATGLKKGTNTIVAVATGSNGLDWTMDSMVVERQ